MPITLRVVPQATDEGWSVPDPCGDWDIDISDVGANHVLGLPPVVFEAWLKRAGFLDAVTYDYEKASDSPTKGVPEGRHYSRTPRPCGDTEVWIDQEELPLGLCASPGRSPSLEGWGGVYPDGRARGGRLSPRYVWEKDGKPRQQARMIFAKSGMPDDYEALVEAIRVVLRELWTTRVFDDDRRLDTATPRGALVARLLLPMLAPARTLSTKPSIHKNREPRTPAWVQLPFLYVVDPDVRRRLLQYRASPSAPGWQLFRAAVAAAAVAETAPYHNFGMDLTHAVSPAEQHLKDFDRRVYTALVNRERQEIRRHVTGPGAEEGSLLDLVALMIVKRWRSGTASRSSDGVCEPQERGEWMDVQDD